MKLSAEQIVSRGKRFGSRGVVEEVASLLAVNENWIKGWTKREGMSRNFHSDKLRRSPAAVLSRRYSLADDQGDRAQR